MATLTIAFEIICIATRQNFDSLASAVVVDNTSHTHSSIRSPIYFQNKYFSVKSIKFEQLINEWIDELIGNRFPYGQ